MSVRIVASIPTAHQINSLQSIGLPIIPISNGSYEIDSEFSSENSAKDWLLNRIEHLYNTGRMDRVEYEDNVDTLTYDSYIVIDEITVSIDS